MTEEKAVHKRKHVYVPDKKHGLWSDIADAAKAEGISVSEFVLSAAQEKIARRDRRTARGRRVA